VLALEARDPSGVSPGSGDGHILTLVAVMDILALDERGNPIHLIDVVTVLDDILQDVTGQANQIQVVHVHSFPFRFAPAKWQARWSSRDGHT